MPKRAVITGANRGIGLEIATQLSKVGYQIIAWCRQASDRLKSLPGCQVIEGVELTDASSILRASEQIGSEPIDLLINNAGLLERVGLEGIDEKALDSIQRQYQLNAIAPVHVTSQLLDRLQSGSKVILITSRMGSIEDNGSGSHYGYRMSKAALNAAGKSMAIDLEEKGIAIGVIHPGWVKTDMTSHTGHLTADQAAAQIIERIDGLTISNTGTFWHSSGERLPW